MTASGGPFELNADLIVIGFGKGGKTLAATLGRQGERVVMVERSAQMYGGTCINIGCVPTKSMVYQAEQLEVGTPHALAYRAAIDTTQGLTAYLRGQNFAMLDNLETVTVLTGTARFVNTTTVGVRTVDGVHAHRERAHHRDRHRFGTRDSDIPGLADNGRVVTSTELLSEPELPGRLPEPGWMCSPRHRSPRSSTAPSTIDGTPNRAPSRPIPSSSRSGVAR